MSRGGGFLSARHVLKENFGRVPLPNEMAQSEAMPQDRDSRSATRDDGRAAIRLGTSKKVVGWRFGFNGLALG